MTAEREQLLSWATQMADPNWCLSVPNEAKDVIGRLVDTVLDLTPRTIHHHRERAALPPGSICMDLNGNAWKKGAGSWVSTGEDVGPLYDEENLTLVVLHVGGEA
jgi:hypothetical protein